MNHDELLAQAAARQAERAAEKAKAAGKAEWYVGIDGQPVGPVPKGYLKEQLDAGKVTGASLVWREELTDWKPLSSFPELRELMADKPLVATPTGAASAPVALTRQAPKPAPSAPKPPEPARTVPDRPPKPAPSRPEAPKPASPAPPKAAPPAPSAPKPSAPVAGGLDLSELSAPAKEEPPPSTAVPVGLAGLAPPPSGRPEDVLAGATATVKAEPLIADAPKAPEPTPAPKPPAPKPPAPEPDEDDLALAGIPADRRRKRAMSPMAFAFIAMATAFGAVSAWFLFGQAGDDPRLAGAPTAGPPVPSGESGSGSEGPDTAPDGSSETTAETPSGEGGGAVKQTSGGRKSTSGGGPKAGGTSKPDDDDGGGTDKPPPDKTSKPCDPDDPFCNSGGPSGPSAGADDDGGSGSGSGLTPAQAQGAVARNKASLMRRCRAMVTKPPVKVGATIVVGSSGSVKSVATSGGSGSPGLAGCVRSRIKNWGFPPSGGSTTINVAFSFL